MPDNAAAEAQRLLDGVWTPIAGSLVIPVDPVRICRELGIDVFDAELDASVSGAIVKRVAKDPTILLNNKDSENRKRFTCAHELGHFVQRADDPEMYEFVDYRGPLSGAGVSQPEIFANNFAACLLMPSAEVKRRQKGGWTSVELAFQFRVSQEAMQFRLRNLGLEE